MYICICINIYMYIYMSLHICICTCIYKHKNSYKYIYKFFLKIIPVGNRTVTFSRTESCSFSRESWGPNSIFSA